MLILQRQLQRQLQSNDIPCEKKYKSNIMLQNTVVIILFAFISLPILNVDGFQYPYSNQLTMEQRCQTYQFAKHRSISFIKNHSSFKISDIKDLFRKYSKRRRLLFPLCHLRAKVDYTEEDDEIIKNLNTDRNWGGAFVESDNFGKDISHAKEQNPDDRNIEETTAIRRIEEQQRQIDILMQLVKENTKNEITAKTITDSSNLDDLTSKTATFSSSEGQYIQTNEFNRETNMNIVAPLKAMMFIDGTWLYYSIYERKGLRCPITTKFGRGWQQKYKVDWSALPQIVCEQLQKQQMNQGWSSSNANSAKTFNSNTVGRPVEIVRASVYTSYKKTTDKNSLRVKMFEDMKDANYDVHLMETMGAGEKCVDIQLAVEMLHYATVPNAYDVAIMLSGDKDFMPALVRTRQKGKKTAIVAMKTGCNRALFESPHVKDYDIVWIDDFLDRIIVPSSSSGQKCGDLSPTTTIKVIHDFISHASGDVSSRDIGRYLKSITIGNGPNMLIQLKDIYGGLRFFLTQYGSDVFHITDKEVDPTRHPKDRSFWVGITKNAEKIILSEAERTDFSKEEKEFLKNLYSNKNHIDEHSFYHTHEDPTVSLPKVDSSTTFTMEKVQLPPDLLEDYSSYTVAQLKNRCRERGLMVSGKKADLLQRVLDDVEIQVKEYYQTQQRSKQKIKLNTFENKSKLKKPYSGVRNVDIQIIEHLDNLIKEYVLACGGQAGSRDVGRYLSANSNSKRKEADIGSFSSQSALTELKNNFGSLNLYLANRKDVFSTGHTNVSFPDDYGFPIRLK